MPPKILVSSNCQTEGLTEALCVMLDGYPCQGLPIPPKRSGWDYLSQALTDDIRALVSSDPVCQSPAFKQAYPQLKVLYIPQLYFSAFHPDIVYATDAKQAFVRCLDADYHSAICLWAWKAGLSAEATCALFREEVFSALGYFGRWELSTQELALRFRNTGLNFERFFSSVQRKMPFMHTLNHPTLFALSELAKQVAVKLGAPESLYEQPIERVLTDRLDAIRWPIYPALAQLYCLPGMYRWKIRRAIYCSLHEFITQALASYQAQAFKPAEILFHNENFAQFDLILRKYCAPHAQSAGVHA